MLRRLLYTFIGLAFTVGLNARQVSGQVRLQRGQIVSVKMDVKNTVAQQALGQAIEFRVNGNARHQYEVTMATGERISLHHVVKQLAFNLEGMGGNRSFDSDRKSDSPSPYDDFGRQMLGRRYEMIIDGKGNTISSKSAEKDSTVSDERVAFVTDMLKDLFAITQPAASGEAGFFKVLPDTMTSLGASWTEVVKTQNARAITTYTLKSVSDSLIAIEIKGTATSIFRVDRKGVPTTTNMTSTVTGDLKVEGATGVMREKHLTIESTGNTEAAGTTVPLSAKTTISISVEIHQ